MAGNWQVTAQLELLTDSNHLEGISVDDRTELNRWLGPCIEAAEGYFAFEWYHSLTNRQKTNATMYIVTDIWGERDAIIAAWRKAGRDE